ncbi:MAG: alpha/beta fold hydrolase [Nitrosopumilaceae archaeon]
MIDKVLVNGTKLYYADTGDDKSTNTITLIHGFPFSHEMWKQQIELLKKNHRVIAYDIRGHGKSEVGDGQYTLELFVDDLIGLLDHLRIEKTIVCGLSMGGYIALRAVERNPERFKALVLCDTSSLADSNEAKLKRASSIKTIKNNGVQVFVEGFVKAIFSPKSLSAKISAVEIIKNMILSNSTIGICGTLLALAGRTDTTNSLSKITIPTLILVGENDNVTPLTLSQLMHEKIPNSEFHVVKDAAHMSNLENTTEFNQYLINFLNQK